MGAVIIDIPEALPATEAKGAQPDVSGLSSVAAIVLTVEVERVEMLATPVKDDLKDSVELCQGRVAADKESAPDKQTNLAQGDTQLIDTGQFQWLAHGVSVTQYAVSLKISPRNLALSTEQGDNWDHVAFDPAHRGGALARHNAHHQTKGLVKDM